ncbi:MAG: hypothetical protein WB491_13215 [Candidatus Aquilonibacter sp.]
MDSIYLTRGLYVSGAATGAPISYVGISERLGERVMVGAKKAQISLGIISSVPIDMV